MTDYADKFEQWLSETDIVNLEELTITDDTTPFNEKFQKSDEMPELKDGDSVETSRSRIIGPYEPERTIKVTAKRVIDKTTPMESKSVYVYHKESKTFVRRKLS